MIRCGAMKCSPNQQGKSQNMELIDAQGKLNFEDIANTQEIRTPFEGYALGGTLSLLDDPKLTNRQLFSYNSIITTSISYYSYST